METVSVSVIAEACGLSERRIQQLAKEGIIPKAKRGKYELIPVVNAYIEFLHSTLPTPSDLAAEKLRLTAAQADKTELEVAVAREELIPAEEVLSTWQAMIGAMRAKLLAVPTKAAPGIVAARELPEAEHLIRGHIYEALTAIASDGLP